MNPNQRFQGQALGLAASLQNLAASAQGPAGVRWARSTQGHQGGPQHRALSETNTLPQETANDGRLSPGTHS